MPTPDDVRAAYRAMLNHVPTTMVSSHAVLSMISSLGSVKGDDGEISVEKLHQLVGKLAATVSVCILTLDNQVERLEGRPGIPDDRLEAIMSEFGLGGS
jgi:hypothetical protein